MKVRLDHHPNYWGKKMFQTTSQGRICLPWQELADNLCLTFRIGFQFNFQCFHINNSGTILQSTKYLGETLDDPLLVGMRYASPNSICYLFSHPIQSPITHRRFCTKAFTHNSFYTHTDAVPQRGLCTETLLQSNGFTQRSFGAQWKIPSHRRLYKGKRLPGAAFTHRRFYAQELLDTEAFTRRTFCTEKPLLRRNFATHLDVRHAWSPQSVSPSHLKRGLQELALQVFSHSLVGAQRSWSLTCPRRRWCKWGRKQCRCFVWVLKELIEADHLCICTCVDDV